MFRRSPRSSQGSRPMAQPVEGVRLSDSMLDTDVLDMDLFNNDFDLWFTRAIIQCYLAIAIQKEHLGHAAVNPKAVIEQVEARYWREPSQNVGSNVGLHNPGSELFGRIKAARATKDNKTLDVFLNQLYSDILLSCRRLRSEKAAELDADAPFSPSHIHRATTPSSTTSSNPSSEDSQKATGTPIETESSLPDDVVQSVSLSVQGGLPLAQPLEAERPMHEYTSMLYEYASGSGKQPEYKKEWVSLDIWRCEAVFNGIHGVGEARSWKHARHIASQKICQTLGITKE